MIRKIKSYYCDYCGTDLDFGNICGSCKGKKRKGVKLVKKYKKGVSIVISTDDTCLKELRAFATSLPNDLACPKEYVRYNRTDKHSPRPDIDNVSPRGWFMFMLDEFEKKHGKRIA